MAAPRAVVFDLDETLIVEDRAVEEALRATASTVAERHGVDAGKIAASVRSAARARWRATPTWAWCHAIGISSSEGLCGDFAGEGDDLAALRALLPAYRAGAWHDALKGHGIDDPETAAALAHAYVEEDARRRVPYPEAERVLAALRPRARLALLTNGASRVQRDKLERSRLSRWFDAIVVSGEVGVGKPDRRAFDPVLSALRVAAADAVMVGDSLERDVLGARNAGMRSAWVDRAGRRTPPEGSPAPDWRLDDLGALPDLLARA